MKSKGLADFDVEKLKKVELEIWKTQWPMCKADTHANRSGVLNFFETLVKAEAMDVENRKAPANKMTHAIT